MAYTVYIKYKKSEAAILNISFGRDASIYLTDMISRYAEDPVFEIIKYDLPMDTRRTKEIKVDETRYKTKNQPKFSHHASGFFQLSSANKDKGAIISGIDDATNQPKGVSVNSFSLKTSTNDDGPFLVGKFWGLNNIPLYNSKTSDQIYFQDNDINSQGLYNTGSRIAFAVYFFHIPIEKLSKDDLDKDWIKYDYINFKRPLILKLLKEPLSQGYVIGLACLKARCEHKSKFGFIISGGPGGIDKESNTCKNVSVIFPKPDYDIDLNYISLDL